MSNIDKKIAEAIVYAQIASDAGKGIEILEGKNIFMTSIGAGITWGGVLIAM